VQFKNVLKILGIFLVVHSVGLLPPIFLSWYDGDEQFYDFFIPLCLTFSLGMLLWMSFRHNKTELRRHEGFLVVASFWVVLSALSALPFVIGPHLDFADAFFEATSAFTTTGATVMTNLDSLPRSVLFYRQELQWFGGMGVVILAIAVLPLLGMGGMQLYRAETPGPMKDEKLTPRIAHTARTFWLIYLGLTVIMAIAYYIAGMTPFDAIAHSFSTISTGGFSTHDDGLNYYNSLAIEIITEIFMFLGAINFSVHFLAIHKHSVMAYLRNAEVKVFFFIVMAIILATAAALYLHQAYDSFGESLRHSAFQTISIITSTGYTTQNFAMWPSLLPALLIFSSFIGGCSGSTAGGMKVIRIMLLVKQGYHEILMLIHPAMVHSIKISGRIFPPQIIRAVWGYFALYVAVFVVSILLLMAGGLDQITAFSAVATSMNNLGPGLGEVASNFKILADWEKFLLAFCMLLGRLEIMTLLVLLTPGYWRR
jgi:trk system potassium uptake protein TrkH